MADKSDGDKEDGEPPKKKSKVKDPKILGIGGIVIAALVYQFALKAPPETEMVEADPDPVEGSIFELEEMVLNLEDENANYLRVGVAVVLTDTEDPAMFEADQAIAKDVIVDYVGSRTSADFAPGQPRQQTKEELSELMVEAYGEDRVVRVLFTALVMQ
ncbi:MAG: flagellar basal body-associated FliL family protein [Acidimicrobiia bacterium]|nr:flagellar basal body-associated FliL family protein [Acidimicrobiia bacterium]